MSDERVWPVPTPHLDALGRRGLRLVATAATPTDPGGRLSLLTGLHARQHGHYIDGSATAASVAGLPTQLRAAGYHTVGVGEVGAFADALDECIVTEPVTTAEPDPERCWYTAAARARGHAAALSDQRRQRLRPGAAVLELDRLLLDPEEDLDGFIAAQAAEALGRMPGDRPWAVVVVFSGPGNALPPPVGFDGLDAAALGRNFAPADVGSLDAVLEPDLPRSVLQNLEPHRVGRLRADYLGRVALIDHGVGQISAALQQRSDAARTWTVLSSDRGQLLGEHGLLGHRSFLGGAVEVPLLVAAPPGRGGKLVLDQDGLFNTVDVAPTVAALAGVDPDPQGPPWSGRSVLPLLQGQPVLPARTANLSESGGRVLIETERHKAVFDITTGDASTLHDLLNDADERVNLIGRGGSAATLDHLRVRLAMALLPLRG